MNKDKFNELPIEQRLDLMRNQENERKRLKQLRQDYLNKKPTENEIKQKHIKSLLNKTFNYRDLITFNENKEPLIGIEVLR